MNILMNIICLQLLFTLWRVAKVYADVKENQKLKTHKSEEIKSFEFEFYKAKQLL